MILMRATIEAWNFLGRALGLAQRAVDPVPHHHVALARLDVDVGRAVLDRLEHERVDPADDGRLVVGVEHVDQLVGLAELVLGLVLLVPGLELGAAAQAGVGLVDGVDDLAGRRHHRIDRALQQDRDVIDHVQPGRIGDGDRDPPGGVAGHRQHDVLLGEVDGQAVDQVGRHVLGPRQIAHRRHLGLDRQRRRQLILVDQLERDQDLAEQAAVLALLEQAALDGVGADAELRDQDLAEQRRDDPIGRLHQRSPASAAGLVAAGLAAAGLAAAGLAAAGLAAGTASGAGVGASTLGGSAAPSSSSSSILSSLARSYRIRPSGGAARLPIDSRYLASRSTPSMVRLISSTRPRFLR
jgi:hypothetical protein